MEYSCQNPYNLANGRRRVLLWLFNLIFPPLSILSALSVTYYGAEQPPFILAQKGKLFTSPYRLVVITWLLWHHSIGRATGEHNQTFSCLSSMWGKERWALAPFAALLCVAQDKQNWRECWPNLELRWGYRNAISFVSFLLIRNIYSNLGESWFQI